LALGCILEAVVGSRDLARSRTFHGQAFGFEVVAAAGGEVLMGAAGVATGRLRLVPAASDPPLPPPSPWELGPRLLGVCSRDLARTRTAVEAAGGWVGPAVRYPYGDFMEECLARGTDDLLWTIPNVRPRRPSPALDADPARLHGELHSAVINVADMGRALAFFAGAGGLEVLFDGEMSGDAIETMIGLPKGARLRLAFLAGVDHAPARLELMQFFGVPVERRERPVGLRGLVFASPEPEEALRALLEAGGRPLGRDRVLGPEGIEIGVRAPV
jgi:catechol 2,3-dioxygenase-like lactoylglutathione lyase family enzyme